MALNELHLAYLSQLAPGCDYSVFASVSRAARRRNVKLGVAGVLLFDGQRFFQWLYGIPASVSQMMDTISGDLRHMDLSIRLNALLPSADYPASWRVGFVEEEALDELSALCQADVATMLPAIASLIEQADLDTPVMVTALLDYRERGIGAEA